MRKRQGITPNYTTFVNALERAEQAAARTHPRWRGRSDASIPIQPSAPDLRIYSSFLPTGRTFHCETM